MPLTYSVRAVAKSAFVDSQAYIISFIQNNTNTYIYIYILYPQFHFTSANDILVNLTNIKSK
jgi:hypothetical protein